MWKTTLALRIEPRSGSNNPCATLGAPVRESISARLGSKSANRSGARLPIPDRHASETNDRRLQQPRVFYRREPERDPFVVARRTGG